MGWKNNRKIYSVPGGRLNCASIQMLTQAEFRPVERVCVVPFPDFFHLLQVLTSLKFGNKGVLII